MPLAARAFGQLLFLLLNFFVRRVVKSDRKAVWGAMIASAILDLKFF
jgi:hypothetical protein